MLWKGKVKISGNLSKQPFSRGSGRITLKTAYENIFTPENPQILGTGSYSRVFTVLIRDLQTA